VVAETVAAEMEGPVPIFTGPLVIRVQIKIIYPTMLNMLIFVHVIPNPGLLGGFPSFVC
jgi:hypothetical protein